jgi:hypothetical protein
LSQLAETSFLNTKISFGQFAEIIFEFNLKKVVYRG